jgi:PAS domain S-box-containing protein
MTSSAPWSIRRRLPLGFAAVVGIIVAALTSTSYIALRRSTLEAQEERLERIAAQFSNLMDSADARELVDRLQAVAATPAVVELVGGADASAPAARQALEDAGGGTGGLQLWSAVGELLLDVSESPEDVVRAVPPTIANSTGISRLRATDDSTVFYDHVAPVRRDGRTVGAVVARTRVRDSTAEAMEAILGPTGNLLFGNADESLWISGPRVVTAAPPAGIVERLGVTTSFVRDGSERLGATTALSGTPWVVLVEIERDEVLRPAREFLARTLALAAVLMAIGVAAAWMLGRRLTAPFETLAHAASRIATGDYSTRVDVQAPIDAARVATAFNSMTEEVERRTEALVASELRWLSLVNATAQIVWFADADGGVRGALPSWQTYTGQSFEEVRGGGWLQAVHPGDRARFDETWFRATSVRGYFAFECRIRGEDGEHRLFNVRGVPVRGRDGQVAEWVGTCTDIEDQRAATRELRRAEGELRQAQKMEAIGRLAGGIAHDFNNILTGILAPASLARARLDDDDPLAAEMDEISAGAKKAAELTRQLLTVGRSRTLDLSAIDLNDVVSSSGRLLRRVIGEQIEIMIALAEDVRPIRANRSELEQVLLNLAINARDAMPRGGTLTLETLDVELGPDYVRKHPSVRAGSYVMLAVSDTGSGMSTATLERIFEPFFTTKEPGEGTGLGLATVHGIVTQSGGHVWVYSEESLGTTFKVYLPAIDEPLRVGDGVAPRQDSVVGGSEIVMVVEDNDQARKAAVRSLQAFGYEVLSASDGAEALSMLEQRTDVGIVVSDMVMPHMSGAELANRLGEIRPGLPVLFLSGYADAAAAGRDKLRGDEPFLQKPFTPEALADAVRGLLDGADPSR